jgi:predicted Zn-ribbon and HTH transcriptional regulator
VDWFEEEIVKAKILIKKKPYLQDSSSFWTYKSHIRRKVIDAGKRDEFESRVGLVRRRPTPKTILEQELPHIPSMSDLKADASLYRSIVNAGLLQEVEEYFKEKNPIVSRRCLKCDFDFQSEHLGNRICPTCKGYNENVEFGHLNGTDLHVDMDFITIRGI